MTKILKKLCIPMEKYQKEGREVTRWLQVGSILESDKGGKFMLLDKTFNPAGVETEPGRKQIIISMFDPEDKGDKQSSGKSEAQALHGQRDKFEDDEIPF